MKTLILNGSPRKNGDTAALISELRKHLAGDVKVVSAYNDNISPCRDCRYCWENEGCSIQDNMQGVYEAINKYDNIVIASPLYYSQLTGPLMSLSSRFQCYYAAKRFRGVPIPRTKKKGVLILVGGGDGSVKPAQESANIIFRIANADCIGTVFSLNTDKVPAQQDDAAMGKARDLALELNRLYDIGTISDKSCN